MPTPQDGSCGAITADRPVRPDGNGKDMKLPSPFSGQAQPSAQALQGSVNRSLGGNPEMLVKILGGCAGAETVHADKYAIVTDHGIPAPAHGGFDCDLDRGVAAGRLLFLLR